MDKPAKNEKRGRKKKKKERENKEAKTPFSEHLLASRIQAKELEIEKLQDVFKALAEKNSSYKQRNERLRAEQARQLKYLLNDAKDRAEDTSKKVIVDRDQVDEEIHRKWDYIREKRRLFEELQSEISSLVKQNAEKQRERDRWLQYKIEGSRKHAIQNRILEEEIKTLQQSFSEVDELFKQQLETSKREVRNQTKTLRDKKMDTATEESSKHLKVTEDKKWLKKEIMAYQKEVQELEKTVQELEKENLQLVTRLYEQKGRDIKTLRDMRRILVRNSEFSGDWEVARGKTEFSMDYIPKDYSANDSPPEFPSQPENDEEKDIQDDALRGPGEKWLPVIGKAMPIYPRDPRLDDPESSKFCRPQSRPKWVITPTMRRMART